MTTCSTKDGFHDDMDIPDIGIENIYLMQKVFLDDSDYMIVWFT